VNLAERLVRRKICQRQKNSSSVSVSISTECRWFESAALRILSSQANGIAFEQNRAERQRFGKNRNRQRACPWPISERCSSKLDDFRMNMETFRCVHQLPRNFCQRCRGKPGVHFIGSVRSGRRGVGRTSNPATAAFQESSSIRALLRCSSSYSARTFFHGFAWCRFRFSQA